jgi:predicted porin
MKKTLIAAGIAAVIAAPAAFADATLYGKVNYAVEDVDTDGGNSVWTHQNRGSRIGVKGSEDLGNGMSATFTLEYDALSNDEDGNATGSTQAGAFSNRTQFVGLKGGFGEVRLAGRHSSPLKISSGFVDVFADTAADYDGELLSLANVRGGWEDNVVAYITPTVNGLHAAVASVLQEAGGTNDGLADVWSAMAMYKNGPLTASFGYLDADGTEDWRVAAGYTMGDLTVNAMYADQEVVAANAGDVIYLSAKYKMGNNTLKAAYADHDVDNAADRDGFAVGVNHAFSKRTSVDVLYGDTDNGATADVDVMSVQLNHSF